MKKVFVSLLIAFLLSPLVNAQLGIHHPSRFLSAKNGTTYVVMGDTASKNAHRYIEVFKKYWTISKIGFITPAQIKDHANEENSFITFSEFRSFYTKEINGQRFAKLISYANVAFQLWMFRGSWFKKKGDIKKEDIELIADLHLAHFHTGEERFSHKADSFTFIDYYQIDTHDDFPFSRGLLSNYIKRIAKGLKDGEESSHGVIISLPLVLSKLKSDTLFIPTLFVGSRQNAEKYVFQNYPYPYKVIDVDELNKKLLNDNEPFYYIYYSNALSWRAVNIIYSATGSPVYADYYKPDGEFGPDEIRKLMKEMGRD